MAFTRQNTGSQVRFNRDGAVNTFNTPSFQIFSASTTKSNYSLGGNWSIQIDTNANTLQFLNNQTSVFTLNQTGADFQITNLALPSYSPMTTPTNPIEGTMINQGGDFLVYI